jgi:hypothetical protein
MFGSQAASITASNGTSYSATARRALARDLQTYGPLLKTFAAVDPAGQVAVGHDVMELIAKFNRAADGSVVIPSEYLEIVITRR